MKALKHLESSHKWTSVLTCMSFVCTRLSFIFTCLYSSFTSLSFVFTCLYLSLTRLHLSAVVSNSSSLIFTRLHLSALVSHSSALVLSLVCNISNNQRTVQAQCFSNILICEIDLSALVKMVSNLLHYNKFIRSWANIFNEAHWTYLLMTWYLLINTENTGENIFR